MFSSAYSLFFPRHPFSRSYGVILPSSLTMVLPRVLEYSSCLPVSVLVRVRLVSIASFLGSRDTAASLLFVRSPSDLSTNPTDLPIRSTYFLGRTLPSVRSAYPSASTLLSNDLAQYRNLHLLSIAYAFQPGLRSRLTLRGRALLRNPSAFDG